MQTFDKPGKKTPLLVVYGFVELHRNTSEWSAQGLGNSLSGLVEAGGRSGRRIVVIEERKMGEQRGEGRKNWEDRVPMLNGSVRRVGLESEDGAWSGRTVEVGRIIGRWFRFGRCDWDL